MPHPPNKMLKKTQHFEFSQKRGLRVSKMKILKKNLRFEISFKKLIRNIFHIPQRNFFKKLKIFSFFKKGGSKM